MAMRRFVVVSLLMKVATVSVEFTPAKMSPTCVVLVAEPEVPSASATVTVTVSVPALAYVCVPLTTKEPPNPVTVPESEEPSPQLMVAE